MRRCYSPTVLPLTAISFETPVIIFVGAIMALYGIFALTRHESALIAARNHEQVSAARRISTLLGLIWAVTGVLLAVGAVIGSSTGAQIIGYTTVVAAIILILLFVVRILVQGVTIPLRPSKKESELPVDPLPMILPSPGIRR